MKHHRFSSPLIVLWLAPWMASAADAGLAVRQSDDRLVIAAGDHPIATYVFRDPKILRPYFTNVRAPGGFQVTRNHPPVQGQDADDHATMHPGIWLAFGDINGVDFWRNKGRIEHLRLTQPPTVHGTRLMFATLSRLLDPEGHPLGDMRSSFTFTRQPAGYLLIWEAMFIATEQALVFGDQEEMGFGVRVATSLTERNGGRIINSAGIASAGNTWGRPAEWCDDSGVSDGRRLGVTLMTDPANFRASWWHNRDYGLMVANPFGRQAMKQGDPSRVVIKPGDTLRLCFGALLHASPADEPLDLATAYRDFVRLCGE